MLVGEVLADDGDELHVREKRCGDGEVGRASADDFLRFTERGFDRVECDAADDENGHVCSWGRNVVPAS